MNLETLAKAVEDDQLRASLQGRMSTAEASAFEAYSDEYQDNDMIFNKSDRY